jgi:hypothetical protein
MDVIDVMGEGRTTIIEPSLFDSGGTDLSNMRFARCRFLTAASRPAMENVDSNWRQGAAKRGYWRHGVVLRTKEGFGMEFEGCAFRGPANPMLLVFGGQFSLLGCSFHTETVLYSATPSQHDVNERSWNGTDVYLPSPLTERQRGGSQDDRTAPATFTARNVSSVSAQFLSTYPWVFDRAFQPSPSMPVDPTRNLWNTINTVANASVTLINVHHRAAAPAMGSPSSVERPAIYWSGPRHFNVALVLQGCTFAGGNGVRGSVFVSAAKDNSAPLAPVVDLGAKRVGGGEVLKTHPELITIPVIARLGVG